MRIPRVCVCVRMFIAVQEMAEAQMLKLGVCPHVEEEGEEPNLAERAELNSSCTAGNFNEDACFIRQLLLMFGMKIQREEDFIVVKSSS